MPDVRRDLDDPAAYRTQAAGLTLTGIYDADHVRGLPGRIIAICQDAQPGRYVVTWVEPDSGPLYYHSKQAKRGA